MTFKPSSRNVSVTGKGTKYLHNLYNFYRNCTEYRIYFFSKYKTVRKWFYKVPEMAPMERLSPWGRGEGNEEKVPCAVWERDGAEEQAEKVIFGSIYPSCSILVHTWQLGNSTECAVSDFKGESRWLVHRIVRVGRRIPDPKLNSVLGL